MAAVLAEYKDQIPRQVGRRGDAGACATPEKSPRRALR